MKLTTMRVRPARADVLRNLGVTVRRDQVEVTVYGETIAVVAVNEQGIDCEWAAKGISKSHVAEMVEGYVALVTQARNAGAVPA